MSNSDAEPFNQRRRFLKALAAGCGGLFSADVLASGVSQYVRKSTAVSADGDYLAEPQLRFLAEFCEVIIPQTETAGAKATDTHGYIDNQLARCTAPTEAKAFKMQLMALQKKIMADQGRDFAQLSPQMREKTMRKIVTQSAPYDQPDLHFFRKIKLMALTGYYTSEVGATAELRYDAIPGGYNGNYAVSEDTRTWATWIGGR